MREKSVFLTPKPDFVNFIQRISDPHFPSINSQKFAFPGLSCSNNRPTWIPELWWLSTLVAHPPMKLSILQYHNQPIKKWN